MHTSTVCVCVCVCVLVLRDQSCDSHPYTAWRDALHSRMHISTVCVNVM